MKPLSPARRTTALRLGILGLSFVLASSQTESSALKVVQIKRIQNGVELKTDRLNVKVQFYADDRVRVAARLLEIPQREKLTIGQSRDLAETIESLGFGVEPDARYDGAYTWDQELGVFKPSSGKVVPPSQNYPGAASSLNSACWLPALMGL